MFVQKNISKCEKVLILTTENGGSGGKKEKMTAKKFVEEFEDFCRS